MLARLTIHLAYLHIHRFRPPSILPPSDMAMPCTTASVMIPQQLLFYLHHHCFRLLFHPASATPPNRHCVIHSTHQGDDFKLFSSYDLWRLVIYCFRYHVTDAQLWKLIPPNFKNGYHEFKMYTSGYTWCHAVKTHPPMSKWVKVFEQW